VALLTVWTAAGLAKRAIAIGGGAKVQLTQMALGDGGGVVPVPNPAQVALVNEVARYSLNSLAVVPPGGTIVQAEAICPAGDGPFWIREVGLYDFAGDLLVVGNTPETEKIAVGGGALNAVYVRVPFDVVNPALAVTLIVDPAVVMASREYVDEWAALAQHYAWLNFR